MKSEKYQMTIMIILKNKLILPHVAHELYKDAKVSKISHGPDVLHGHGKEKLRIPSSQKMKRQQYQMIMIIFSQKQTDPPTCRS